jgi:MYXO-CTERM domain-containing protein
MAMALGKLPDSGDDSGEEGGKPIFAEINITPLTDVFLVKQCGGSPCLAGLDEAACRCVVACEPDGCGCRSSGAPGGALLVVAMLVWRRRRYRVA